MSSDVTLREVIPSDLAILFEQRSDPEAIRMAAFTQKGPLDLEAFIARQMENLRHPTVIARTILCDGEVAGDVASFMMEGQREVSYWLGRAYWGRGIGTQALRLFLDVVTTRPLYAHAAKDNLGSVRVLEKCGFTLVGELRSFAAARDAEIEEVVMRLDAKS